jgi:hypothetical protein
MKLDDIEKRLEDSKKKIDQLKAQKQAILNREKEQERKERTKRLIEIGAIFEKGLKSDTKYKAMAAIEYLMEHDLDFSKLVEYMEKKEAENKEQEEKTKKPPQ